MPELLLHTGVAMKAIDAFDGLISRVPGRLAVATVGGNAVFAAVTGVGVASAAAFSHVAYPAMREARYSRSFATGCIAGSSVLGLLIPPSVFMIVWAILTEQSVGKLFAAGVFPGLLLALLYAVYCMVYAKLRPSAAPEMASDQQVRLTRGQIGGSLGVGVLIAVRSVTLGDQLSRWMVLACLCLAQMTAGLAPTAFTTAWADWAMHLALSPAKQMEMQQQLLERAHQTGRQPDRARAALGVFGRH